MFTNVRPYVNARDVVTGAVTIRPLAGRNGPTAVERPQRGSIIKRFLESEASARERRFVAELLTRPGCPLNGHVAGIDDDGPTDDDTLRLRLIGGAHPLSALNFDQAGLSTRVADSLGRVVGLLHSTGPPDWAEEAATVGLRQLWLPDMNQFEALSLANRQLIRVLQKSAAFEEPLISLEQRASRDTLIHGDLRLTNILLSTDDTAGEPHIWLIDWEAAGLGDPHRDLGAVLADLLTRWATSMSYRSDSPTRMVAGAQIPLARVQSFAQQMLRAYDTSIGRMSDREMVVAHAGVGLITNALTIGDGASMLAGHQVLLLQLAEHCLSAPTDVSRHLLGL